MSISELDGDSIESTLDGYQKSPDKLKSTMARKIKALLAVESRANRYNDERDPRRKGYYPSLDKILDSNCHTISGYLMGISNDIGKIMTDEDATNTGNFNMKNEDEILQNGYEFYNSKKDYKNFPKVVIFYDKGKVQHSMIILGQDENGLYGFEQKQWGGDFNFDWIENSNYKGKIFLKTID